LKGCWVEPDIRDNVVDEVKRWKEKTGYKECYLVKLIGIGHDKLCEWKKRYGKANEHNGQIPRDYWLENWLRQSD